MKGKILSRTTPVKYEAGRYGEQAYDIYSWLAKEQGKIFIDGVINTEVASTIIAQVYALKHEAVKEIEFVINSPGGIVYDCNTILDAMELAKRAKITVKTTCIGKAMSCGALIFLNGSHGYRTITPRSYVMMHDISYGQYGSHIEMENELEHVTKLKNALKDHVILNTNITRENINDYFDRNRYIDAYEAVDLGIADSVIEGI